jgi:hypothetical protein
MIIKYLFIYYDTNNYPVAPALRSPPKGLAAPPVPPPPKRPPRKPPSLKIKLYVTLNKI